MGKSKKCPFCGGRPTFKITSENVADREVGFGFKIKCAECHATYPEEYIISITLTEDGEVECVNDERELAIENWNKRYE